MPKLAHRGTRISLEQSAEFIVRSQLVEQPLRDFR
jgi:hypothetical protein